MSYWTIILLLLAIAYLSYRHPLAMSQYLPRWLRPAEQVKPGQETCTNQEQGPSDAFESNQPDVKILVEDDDTVGEQTTPKANVTKPESKVPSLSLDGISQDRAAQRPLSSNETTASKPKPPQPAASMLPPPRPRPAPTSTGLMPPPSRASLAPPASSASALRVPSNGALPNRGPPANSQQRVGGGLSANGVIAVPNPRGKILLSPGHSPMDWAALTKSSNLSGVSTFQRVTPSMLKNMTGRKGKPAWSSWQGKVYNITPYLDFHPGGKAELMKGAGRDGTKLFMDVHPWVNWENMLEACLVGVMVPEGHGMQTGGTDLEDID